MLVLGLAFPFGAVGVLVVVVQGCRVPLSCGLVWRPLLRVLTAASSEASPGGCVRGLVSGAGGSLIVVVVVVGIVGPAMVPVNAGWSCIQLCSFAGQLFQLVMRSDFCCYSLELPLFRCVAGHAACSLWVWI